MAQRGRHRPSFVRTVSSTIFARCLSPTSVPDRLRCAAGPSTPAADRADHRGTSAFRQRARTLAARRDLKRAYVTAAGLQSILASARHTVMIQDRRRVDRLPIRTVYEL